MQFKNLGLKIKEISLKFIILLLILSLVITNFLTLSPMIVNNIEDNKYFIQIGNKKIKVKSFKEFFNRKLSENEKKNFETFGDISDNETYFSILYNKYVQKFVEQTTTEIYLNNMNIFVNDKNVNNYIKNYYLFQKNYKFDINKYKNYLKKYHLSDKEFKENIKKEIAYVFFSKMLLQSEFLLPKESKFSQSLINETRYVKYLKFNLLKIINKQKCSKKEILEYLQSYNEEKAQNAPFPIEIYHMQYIVINPKEIKIEKPSEEELKDWYKKNEKKYYSPEFRDYSFIQKSSKKEIEKIQKHLKKHPEDFEKFSQKKMLPNTCYQIVDIKNLHHVDIKQVPIFLECSEINGVNQISEVIDLFGEYYLFKLNGVEKSFKLDFETVKNRISEEIICIKQKEKKSEWMKKIKKIPECSSDYFEKIQQITHQKIRDSKYFNVLKVPKDCKSLSLQRFILSDEIMDENRKYANTKDPSVYKNHLLEDSEDENVYVIKLKGFKIFPNSLDPNQKDYHQEQMIEVISQNIKKEKTKKKINKILNNIIKVLNKNDNINEKFQDFYIKFTGKEVKISSKNKNIPINLVNVIFSIEEPKKNKYFYGFYIDEKKNEYSLIKLIKIKKEKLSKEKIKEIEQNTKKNCEKILLMSILNNLYSKYKVIYF